MKEALIKNRKERLILPSRKDESNQPAQSDSKKTVLETERLVVRQMAPDDFENVRRFLADPEVMYAYEHGFDDDEVRQWIAQNQKRYTQDGFGLWLIIEKKTGESIGDCGITWQEAKGKPVLEIGYHLEKNKWHQGFAIEAAKACKALAFEKLHAEAITSIIRDTNLASQKVALANGMKPIQTLIKQYRGYTMPHLVFSITKEQYEKERLDNEKKPAGNADQT